MTSDPRFRVPLMLVVTVLLHTAVLSRLRVDGVMPDLMLLVAVAAGVAAGPARGAVIAFCGGMALDVFLLTPMGLSALVYSLVAYAVGVAHEGVLRNSWYIPVLTVLVASAGGVVLYAVAAWMLGEPTLNARLLLVTGVVALANAVLAPPVLRFVRWSLAEPRSRLSV